jgi:parvulin-like peptidyl-prolyl isomerase
MGIEIIMSRESPPEIWHKWVRLAVMLVLFAASKTSTACQEDTILATVNGEPITGSQIERDLARTLKDLKLQPEAMSQARSVALEKLINQKVVLDFLRNYDLAAGENEVRLEVEELKQQLATVEKSLDDYLQQTKQTRQDLEFNLAWQLSWKRYLRQMLTDERLEAHFRKNNRQFDGTELRVAHLLLKAKASEKSRLSQLLKKAEEIRLQIESGKKTWDDAVAEFSEAPTKDAGGEIGWIKRTGPMPTSFTNAAFKLSKGEISEPVATRFGVHLVRCLKVKPGKLGWRDRLNDVRKSAARELFDAVVAKHRPNVTIEHNKPSN